MSEIGQGYKQENEVQDGFKPAEIRRAGKKKKYMLHMFWVIL